MRALALVPGSTNLHFVDRPEPQIAAPDDIKLRVLRVGICVVMADWHIHEQSEGSKAV